MANRPDALSVAYYLVIAGVGVAYSYANPGTANLEGYVVVLLILAYPAAWAFIIRRALAVRLYRNQALAIGLYPLAFGFGLATGVLGLSIFVLFALFLVDSSARAGRRSDPQLRDTLHWSKLRGPLWVLTILATVFQDSDILARGTILTNRPPSGIVGNASFIETVFVVAFSAALLSFVAFRSRDPALRRNLGWFGAALVATLMSPVLAANVPYKLGAAAGFVLLGFFLYKSAKSLVPINPMPLDLVATDAVGSRPLLILASPVPQHGI